MKVIKRNRQYLYGISNEHKNIIKKYCTIENPKYKNAIKFSKYGYTTIPKNLYYWEEETVDSDKILSIPSGIDIKAVLELSELDVENQTVHNKVEFPSFLLNMREEQERAKLSYFNSYERESNPKSVIHLPTGKGKTILALNIISELKEKALILVHKNDLVVGWQNDIEKSFGGKIKSGLIKAKKFDIGEQITIATVQTLSRMSEDKINSLVNEFGIVVCDEVHHIGANIFNIIDKFNSHYKLGLSATPKRSDGLNVCLEFFLGGLCYKYEYKKEDEDISKVEVIIKDARYKYLPIVVDNGDVLNYYSCKKEDIKDNYTLLTEIPYEVRPRVSYLNLVDEMVMSKSYFNQICNEAYREYKKGHSILMLFTHKEHIEKYFSAFSNYVDEEDLIKYYGDSKENDEKLLNKVELKRNTITFATYAKATEGTNAKRWEVLFLVGSLNSEKNVEQAVGRIRRKREDKLNPVRVYDYYTNTYSLRNHMATRVKVYNKLKFTIHNESGFTQGTVGLQKMRLT